MKAIAPFFIFTYLLLGPVSAAEIHAQIALNSDSKQFKEGDLIEGAIKVWPIENADLKEFKKYQDNIFVNSLLLAQIHSIETSPNNADVIEIKGLFVAKMGKPSFPVVYKGQTVAIEDPGIGVTPLPQKAQDYFIMDQLTYQSMFAKILCIAVALAFLALVFLKRKAVWGFLTKYKNDPIASANKKFKGMFQRASSRSDFEEIYATRNEWLKHINEQAPAYNEFFKIMNQHQYKKDWGAPELNEVKESFDIIRGSFK